MDGDGAGGNLDRVAHQGIARHGLADFRRRSPPVQMPGADESGVEHQKPHKASQADKHPAIRPTHEDGGVILRLKVESRPDDLRFYDAIPRLFLHNPAARDWFAGDEKKAAAGKAKAPKGEKAEKGEKAPKAEKKPKKAAKAG